MRSEDMELSDRKKKILRAVVDNYIYTAEPVGSKTVASMPGIGFSSATVRNEMAELEALGLLEHPHTSAGRVPSAYGYRLYVDELMQGYKLSVKETERINEALNIKISELDRALSEVGRLVARLINYPAYSLTSRNGSIAIRQIELIKTDSNSFVAVLVTNRDVVKNKIIRIQREFSEQDLRILATALNVSLTDISFEEMTPELLLKIERSVGQASYLAPAVIEFVFDVLEELSQDEVIVSGESSILVQPEYKDVNKAQKFIAAVTDENVLANIPVPDKRDKLKILIGPETVSELLSDNSVVVASYDMGGGLRGLLGIVGPTRMEYNKVAARLSFLAEGLSQLFRGEAGLWDGKGGSG